MATELGNENIHWTLLILQIPQWAVGLVIFILGIVLLMDPLLLEAVQMSQNGKKYLGYVTACGAFNVIILPVITLLYKFPTPINLSNDKGRLTATFVLQFTCIMVWVGLAVWRYNGYDIDDCKIRRCEGLTKILSYLVPMTIFMSLFTGLVYRNHHKEQKKKKQAEDERAAQELMQQAPNRVYRTGGAGSMGEEEESLEAGSPSTATSTVDSRMGQEIYQG